MNFGPENAHETEERNKNPFYGDTPRLAFPNEPQRQKEAQEFYEIITKHWEILDKSAALMMSLIAEAGNAPANYFDQTFKPMANNTYRLIMYPDRDVKDVPKGAFLPDGRSM